MNKKPYIIAFFVFLIDVFSKQLVIRIVPFEKSISIIDDLFYITYTKNTGAAWSILKDQRILLLILPVIVLFLINKYMNKENLSNLESFSYGMIIGGIVGNLFDRIAFKYVIDFLDFKIFGYDFPVFNLADTFIVVGVIIMIIISIRKDYYERSKSRRK